MHDLSRRSLGRLLAGAAGGAVMPFELFAASQPMDLGPTGLTVEWRTAPFGIDSLRPRFRWMLSQHPAVRGIVQAAFQVRVFSDGPAAKLLFDSGMILSREMYFRPPVPLELSSMEDYRWDLSVWCADTAGQPARASASFTTGILVDADWRSRWIAQAQPPATRSPQSIAALPVLLRRFALDKQLRRALLCVTGVGQYEAVINGQRIGDILAPGWTNFDKTVLYDTFNVTDRLGPGENELSITLGNGFYNVDKVAGRYSKLERRSGPLTARAVLKLSFRDGSTEFIGTDEGWSAREGPTIFSSIYGGEDHDARREWRPASSVPTTGGLSDDSPSAAVVTSGPTGRLTANPVPPVAFTEGTAPMRLISQSPGRRVYDMGRNFAGVPQLRLTVASPGQTVVMHPGELLLPDGSVDQESATEALTGGLHGISFKYIAKGSGRETWRPRFTYTGFRYLQVEGLVPGQDAEVTGVTVGSTADRVGAFECSDDRVNRIHRLILAALDSNAVSLFTDCPHREKLGWLEQFYLNSSTIIFNRHAASLYEKMTADMLDAQLPTGMVPSIAPEYVVFGGEENPFRNAVEFGSGIILAPWAAYCAYGDPAILETAYPGMTAYLDYLRTKLSNGLLEFGLGDWFDLGPDKPGFAQLTSKGMTATATYYRDLSTMARIARLLGRPADENRYTRLAQDQQRIINRAYFDAGRGSYDRGSQTANAMALSLGLVPENHAQAVLDALVGDIEARGFAVTAGDIGFHYVVRALIEARRSDVLLAMITRPDPPSYLNQLAQGATTLTEAWGADRHKSQNHFMLGHIEAWLYGGLAGIAIDHAALPADRIVFRPQLPAAIQWVSCRYRSAIGDIGSRWRRQGADLMVEIDVPAGAQARLDLPVTSLNAVRESGVPLDRANGVITAVPNGDGITIRIGSGSYRFATRI